MECSEVARQLHDYFANATDRESRSEIERHWRSCPSCRDEAEGLGKVWRDLELIRVPPLAADAKQRFDTMLVSYQDGLSDGMRGRRQNGWFWLRPPFAQAFAALLLLVTGLFAGSQFSRGGTSSLEALQAEVRSLKQLVAVSMLEQRSASQRLRGISFTAQMDQAQPEVVDRLLRALDSDSSVNVRLAVLEVLRQFDEDPLVRDHIVRSLLDQPSPLVQVSMIDLLVEMGEARSLPVFERLLENDDLHQVVRERALWGLSELS